MDEKVKNLRKQVTVEDYKNIKNSELFKTFSNLFNFTDEEIEDFEKEYYPELHEEAKGEKVELISESQLKNIIESYKSYFRKVDKLSEYIVDPYIESLPLLHIETLFVKALEYWLGEEKANILMSYIDEQDSEMTFDELYKTLNA